MSETIGNAAKENKPDNLLPNKDNSTAHGKDVTYLIPFKGEGEPFNESCAQRLLLVALTATFHKIRDSTSADATYEIISIHN